MQVSGAACLRPVLALRLPQPSHLCRGKANATALQLRGLTAVVPCCPAVRAALCEALAQSACGAAGATEHRLAGPAATAAAYQHLSAHTCWPATCQHQVSGQCCCFAKRASPRGAFACGLSVLEPACLAQPVRAAPGVLVVPQRPAEEHSAVERSLGEPDPCAAC